MEKEARVHCFLQNLFCQWLHLMGTVGPAFVHHRVLVHSTWGRYTRPWAYVSVAMWDSPTCLWMRRLAEINGWQRCKQDPACPQLRTCVGTELKYLKYFSSFFFFFFWYIFSESICRKMVLITVPPYLFKTLEMKWFAVVEVQLLLVQHNFWTFLSEFHF